MKYIIFELLQLRPHMHPHNPQQYFYYPIFQPLSLLPYSLALPPPLMLGLVNIPHFQNSSFPEAPTLTNSQDLSAALAHSQNQEQERAQEMEGEERTKRRYRKRRTWLQKKFRCNIKGCKSKYSSKIALNSHKRKKHPKQPTGVA